MKALNKYPESLLRVTNPFCPGCGHGIVYRLIGEIIDELGLREKTIGTVGIGCSSRAWMQFECDFASCAHGRAAAVATGVKRAQPDKLVFTYQGDGDSLSIGFSETMYSAIRGENFTQIVINNTVFAMTGGQMAPTTLDGQVTVTSPKGRNTRTTGCPLHVPEMMTTIPNVAFAARVAVDSVLNIRKTKAAILTAFQKQLANKGYSYVEILSPCTTNLRKSPQEAMDWVTNTLTKEYPLNIYVDR
jgi:2-oxoglutarate ferredoxin oxidoreductase subunit beta